MKLSYNQEFVGIVLSKVDFDEVFEFNVVWNSLKDFRLEQGPPKVNV